VDESSVEAAEHLERRTELRGTDLRYCLMTLLQDHGPASIGELRRRLERDGLRVRGAAPNKTIADALRHELGKGRVQRIGRGRYASGARPARTVRRHRARHRSLVASARRRI
jgi:hypothetical protein